MKIEYYILLQPVIYCIIAFAAFGIRDVWVMMKWLYVARKGSMTLHEWGHKQQKPIECPSCVAFWLSLATSFGTINWHLWPLFLLIALGNAYFTSYLERRFKL